MSKPTRGIVEDYDTDRGIGLITAASGTIYAIDHRHINCDGSKLRRRVRVEFIHGPYIKNGRPVAEGVRII